MHKPVMLFPKQNKRLARMAKARDRLYNRKVSEVSKDRAVQYSTSAFILTMSELYGWKAVRSGRVIEEAMEKWGSYTKEDEHKLLEGAKLIGVDVKEVTQLALESNSAAALNMTKKDIQEFSRRHNGRTSYVRCIIDYPA